MHNIRRRLGIICMVVGVVLIIAAAALLLYNRSDNTRAGNAADAVMPELEDAADDPEESTETDDDASAMPTREIDGNLYIGYLTIPTLGLDLPVMSTWDYPKLKIAPCRYFGSTATDDLVICGHNYDEHFGRLKTLQPGDLVTFTGVDGTAIAYEVVEIETLMPTEISAMIESDYDLTLYTCTYGGQSRVTVRCNRLRLESGRNSGTDSTDGASNAAGGIG